MDVIFMTLTELKHDVGMKGPNFERRVVGSMKVVAPAMEVILFGDVADTHTMNHVKEQRRIFKYFPFAVETTDVTLQLTNRQ